MRRLQPINFTDRFVRGFAQCKLGRIAMGGIYVHLNGTWTAVDVLRRCADQTRVFREQRGVGSFHETFNGITDVQEFR